MYPRDWSTTYNSQYRDRRKFSPPHPGFVDESISSRSQGYYGIKPAISEHSARIAEYQARALTAPQSLVAPYGNNNTIINNNNTNINYNASSINHSLPPIQTTRISTSSSALFPTNRSYNSWAHRDLWSTNTRPHTGIYSNYSTIKGGVYRSCDNDYNNNNNNNNYENVADFYSSTNGNNNYPSAPFGASPNEIAPGVWTYDNNNNNDNNNNYSNNKSSSLFLSSLSKDVSKERYHIPGFQGFVRGIQFQNGDTYGKTTKICLDVPTDVPLEP